MHLDESIRGNLIVVGGFLCEDDQVASIAASWVAMREAMGLREDEAHKWNYGRHNAVRAALEARGWGRRERRRLAIDTLRELPITMVADALYDDRESRRSPLDFYKDALDWLLLRHRNWVTDKRPIPVGPHVVVLDQPSAAQAARPSLDPRYAWLTHRETIWYHVYKEKYERGWRFLWAAHDAVQGLREDGFYPSVVISHAKFNPLLEIADAVVGLTLDFVFYNLYEAESDELPHVAWQDEQFIRVVKKFRSKPNGDCLSYGFDIFPITGPARTTLTQWVTRLSTHEDFAYLRDAA
jgi:hypothetical protein